MEGVTSHPRLRVSLPLALVFCSQHIQGMQVTLILPLLVPMVHSFLQDQTVPKEDFNGFAARNLAILVSSYFWACSTSGVVWGLVADRLGRRLALIGGLCLCLSSNLLLAVSTNLPMAVVARILAGLDGNMGVNKILIGDLIEPHNQAQAFSYLEVCYALGTLVAPSLAGLLPGQDLPNFGYAPAFWTGIYASSLVFVILVFVVLRFPETKSRSSTGQADETAGHKLTSPVVTTHSKTGFLGRFSPVKFFSAYHLEIKTIFCYSSVAFVLYGSDLLLSVGAQSPPGGGGLGLHKSFTGYFLLVQGIFRTICSMFVLPSLATSKGPVFTYRVAVVMLGVCLPMLYVPTTLALEQGKALYFGLVALRGVAMSFSVISSIVLVNNATSQETRGAVMGVMHSLGSLSRGLGSFTLAALLSIGTRQNFFSLPYIALALIVALMLAYACLLPSSLRCPKTARVDQNAFSKQAKRTSPV